MLTVHILFACNAILPIHWILLMESSNVNTQNVMRKLRSEESLKFWNSSWTQLMKKMITYLWLLVKSTKVLRQSIIVRLAKMYSVKHAILILTNLTDKQELSFCWIRTYSKTIITISRVWYLTKSKTLIACC